MLLIRQGRCNQMGTSVTAVTFNTSDAIELGNYGADKVLNVTNNVPHLMQNICSCNKQAA